MSDLETTENFWKAWNSFKWPDHKPPSHRCYYREDGSVEFYTMEDLPGRWIEVDPMTYITNHVEGAKVIDGKLHIPKPKTIVKKLKPDQPTGTTCDPRDVAVVAEQGIKWNDCDNEIN